MTAKKWSWRVSHTLNSKKYVPSENGQITSANLKNAGEEILHIYGFGIEFDWQRATKSWWSEKCDIMLVQDTEAKLPVVRFSVPIDVEPRVHKYRIGLQTQSWDETPDAEWKDHGTVWAAKEYELEVSPHPDREYPIFISHSNHSEDKQLLDMLAALLSNNGIHCFVAERVPRYGESLWKKIKSGIISAERVIILWTKHGAKSDDVREELGIAVGARKRFIPIMEKNVKPKGSLIGTEHVPLNRSNYRETFLKLTEELVKSSEEKGKRERKLKPEEEIPF